MKYVVFMCCTIKILIANWPRSRKFIQLFTGREVNCFWLFSPWSRVGHALRPIFMLWLVKIWQVSSCGKFMQHLETVYLTPEADKLLCQLVMFLTVFFYWIYKMKFSWSRVFCYLWLVCLLGFWFRNASLVKLGNPISDGIVIGFHLVWCVSGLKSLKRL